MRSLAFKHGLKSMRIVNPAKMLLDQELWCNDPVHPTIDGYKKIINSIVNGLEAARSSETEEAGPVSLKRTAVNQGEGGCAEAISPAV
jgi:hypothetical protein